MYISDFHIHSHIIITIISQVSKFNLNFVCKLNVFSRDAPICDFTDKLVSTLDMY